MTAGVEGGPPLSGASGHARLARALFIAAVVVYSVSLVMPAMDLGAGNTAAGALTFAGAFLGSFADVRGHNLNITPSFHPLLLLIWLANPAFWVGMVLAMRGRWSGVALAGLAAVALSGIVAVCAWVPGVWQGGPAPRPPAPARVAGPGGQRKAAGSAPAPAWSPTTPWGIPRAGYYTWVAAAALLAAAGLAGSVGGRHRRGTAAPTSPSPSGASGLTC
jgi:hypothetical protein